MSVNPRGDVNGWNDAALITAVRLGANWAFEVLTVRYAAAMFSIAMRICDSAMEAEDVVQESLLIAHRSISSLRSPEKLGAWLRSITRNCALKVTRENRRENLLPFDDNESVIIQASTRVYREFQERWNQRELHDRLVIAVRMLPDEYREPIELRYWCEMRIAEIANFTSLPQSTVKWRLHAAKKRLREIIEQMEE